jgi:NAD(P)-dependent dehydrogenase (short-subunit alcohol dehydrogenase family)
MPAFYAVLFGVGPGIGRAAALRFAQAYPFVILLSRSESSYQPIVDEINQAAIRPSSDSGSDATTRAIGISADAADETAVRSVFDKINAGLDGQLPQDAKLAFALFNSNAGHLNKPFLESKVEDLDVSLGTAV